MRRIAWWLAMGVVAGFFAACTDSYLYDERRDDELPVDRAVTVQGQVCTPGTNEIVRPVKVAIAMDSSQSMRVTDPEGTRATALVELLENLPNDDEVYLSVMVFAGSTSAFLTNGGVSGFQRLNTMTQAQRDNLVGALLNYTNPETGPNRDSTDFVKPLADLYGMLTQDIANARLLADGGAEARAKYSVIFLSDGHPTIPQDDQLLQGFAVRRIRDLKDLADDVRLNTVHVNNAQASTRCDTTGDGGCPLLLVNEDAQRLADMAELGGGEFRDFRNDEPINFLSFKFGLTRRTWLLHELVVDAVNAPAGSPLGVADTDGDGLVDTEEDELGTDVFLKDTDGDGFSDYVETHFGALGADFTPQALPNDGGFDRGCPLELRGADEDCDGLLDCDEQIIGTNSAVTDSDFDGVPDAMEWHLQTQPASRDLEQDPDLDDVTTRQEVRMHTRVKDPDVSSLSVDGYRYTLRASGPIDAEGRQCYGFVVQNVLLAPTRADLRDGGTGRLAGMNELHIAAAFIPADDPAPRTLIRAARIHTARYPIGGIKLPVDGVLRVPDEALVERCQPSDVISW